MNKWKIKMRKRKKRETENRGNVSAYMQVVLIVHAISIDDKWLCFY